MQFPLRCAVFLLLVTSAFEAALGDEPSVQKRVVELMKAGRSSEAISLRQNNAEEEKKRHGERSAEYIEALYRLATLLNYYQRHSESEPLFRLGIQISESALGRNHLYVAYNYGGLAAFLEDTGRLAEAEKEKRRALAIIEKIRGPEHPDVALSQNTLGRILARMDRLPGAEELHRRALRINEQYWGVDHLNVAVALQGLQYVVSRMNRPKEAETIGRRVVAIHEKYPGPNLPSALNSLAGLLSLSGQLVEAESLVRRALEILERDLGSTHREYVRGLTALADLFMSSDRLPEAESLYRRALAIRERSLGPEHTSIASALVSVATVASRRGQAADAEPLVRRAVTIDEKTLGSSHPIFARHVSELAIIQAAQANWAAAVDSHRLAMATLTGRHAETPKNRPEFSKANLMSGASLLRAHARALHRAGPHEIPNRDQAFELAQWALQTSAADSITQMGARFASGDGALADLVRKRQDLLRRRQAQDTRFLEAVGRSDARVVADARVALDGLDTNLNSLNALIAQQFPQYADLTIFKPTAIAMAQAVLRNDEALLIFLVIPTFNNLPSETLAWAITQHDARWWSIPAGMSELADHIAALRCGLDHAAWEGGAEARCSGLMNGAYTANDAALGTLPLYDLGRAYDLYQLLFGQAEDLIKGKNLVIVPSGPLAAFPFHVLVTAKPAVPIPADVAAYADAAWLAKRHAIMVLPSAASLQTLRQLGKASKSPVPFIGFGNPLLVGPAGDDKRAWARQTCPQEPVLFAQVASRSVRGPVSGFFRGALGNIELVRRQYPLPETADELCAVARASGSLESAVYLGERAREKTIKALSASGSLFDARVVHFATHGLLAGETEMVATSKAEPALILTPPDQATEEDDGLLTASEIAQLKLDADWVVLSACNTASGQNDNQGGEALSGLASAFFYAGARALLVSHWAVDSQATVKLIIKTFDELRTNTNIGRAEALRRSMLALISSGGRNAHPATWAPFVVVGEGAR